MLVTIGESSKTPRPQWLRAPAPVGENYRALKSLIEDMGLHTVCESAACPNIGECWNRRTATFMILGNVCTRRCGFCAVQKGAPLDVDYDEPRRVAEAVRGHGPALRRGHQRQPRRPQGWRRRTVRSHHPRDSRAHSRLPAWKCWSPIFRAATRPWRLSWPPRPDVLNHNTETVPRLYRQVRLGARYERSLDMLEYAKKTSPGTPTKSGLMLGLGETSGGSAGRDARSAGAPCRHPDAGTVSAALAAATCRLCGMSRPPSSTICAAPVTKWASGTSKPARWCAAPITPPKRSLSFGSLHHTHSDFGPCVPPDEGEE